MKKIAITTLLATAALIPAVDAVAQANSGTAHEMRMQRTGYFPKVIHIQPGDTIQFIN
ncbi:hypothetical protein [Cognatiyoonia sp.]|uniref:hypothetical protein n=1 Tax=Cognatiyoonia sp. TaxID=2211652 RepID=UPI003F6A11F5